MNWAEFSLCDLCYFENGDRGKNYPGRKAFVEAGVPFINAGHLTRNGIDHDKMNFIPEEHFNRLRAGKVEKGDFLFCLRGSLGKFDRVKQINKGAIASSLVIIRPNQDLDANFFHHYLNGPECQRNIDFLSNGLAQPNLSVSNLKNFTIKLPPLLEQKRIAAILDQADALRRQRQAALDRLNTLGQSIFYDMFGEWTDKSPNWEIIELGDKLDFLTSGSRGWAKYYSDKGAKFIRIQNVKSGHFDDSDLAFVDAPASAEARRTKVQEGDVLLSITADLGRAAVVPDGIGDAHINQHLSILRSSEFNPTFLTAALTSHSSQRNIEKKNNGGTKAGLNFTDIKSLKIIFPSRKKQNEFANNLEQVTKFQNANMLALVQSNILFASLQQRAFRGEL